MLDELYIDGQRLELSGDTGVYLTYQSNIFSDISKITGNHSQTIKVPLTSRNKAIIEGAFAACTTSRYPYKKHAADLYRDGVLLLKGATAVLMKTGTNSAELALAWGVSEGLREIFESDATINQLPDNAQSVITWYGVKTGTAYEDISKRQPVANYGFKANEAGAGYHPVLSAQEILDKIQSAAGVSFTFEAKPWETDDLVLPILKREGVGYKTTLACGSVRTRAINKNGLIAQGAAGESKACAPVVWFSTISGSSDIIELYAAANRAVFANKQRHTKVKLNGAVTFAFYGVTATGIELAKGGLYAFDSYDTYDEGEFVIDKEPASVRTEGQVIYVTYLFDGEEATIEETRLLCLSIDQWRDANGHGPWVYSSIEYNAPDNLVIEASMDQVPTGEDLPLFKNLPEVKQIDFIKAVAQMYGLFAFTDDAGGLHFASVSTLYDRKATAYDWTRYLVHDGADVPEAMEYKINDEARRNNLKYKDSDDYPGWNGAYYISNETLDAERDAVTLPFKPYPVNIYPSFGLYSYDEEGLLVYEASEAAHVCRRTKGFFNNIYTLTSVGVKWPDLLPRYSKYVEILNDAKVLTCTFVLPPVVLHGLDMRRPVYIRNYGAYFGIIEIKTKAGYLAEVKLVKL